MSSLLGRFIFLENIFLKRRALPSQPITYRNDRLSKSKDTDITPYIARTSFVVWHKNATESNHVDFGALSVKHLSALIIGTILVFVSISSFSSISPLPKGSLLKNSAISSAS